ncbi:MAG: hypothetical protein RBT46_04320 [Weeksellaceae bacterium]|jgi:hypothetical protein|nr:hypothetical protein [Weeksellaceae bacterium]MDX9704917.1 hypothetical protein [Weeksellaceae bacterium]
MKSLEFRKNHLNKMLGIAILATPHFKLMFSDEILDAEDQEERQEFTENFHYQHSVLRKFKDYVYSTNVGVEPDELSEGELFDLADTLLDVVDTVVENSVREQINWLTTELQDLALSKNQIL